MIETLWISAPLAGFFLGGLLVLAGAGLLGLAMWVDTKLGHRWWLDRWPCMFFHCVIGVVPTRRDEISWVDVFLLATMLALDAATFPLQVLAFPIYLMVYSEIRRRTHRRARLIAALKGPGTVVLEDGHTVTFKVLGRGAPGLTLPNLNKP